MTAAAQMCLDGPAVATTGHCRRAGYHATAQGVEGSDALLAARLAAGDDHALAEAFDRLAPSVYGSALRILGRAAPPRTLSRTYSSSCGAIRTDMIRRPARCAPI